MANREGFSLRILSVLIRESTGLVFLTFIFSQSVRVVPMGLISFSNSLPIKLKDSKKKPSAPMPRGAHAYALHSSARYSVAINLYIR